MISEFMIKKYCKDDYTKIENYDKATTDNTQIWHLHHRLETHFSDGTERPANARLSLEELKALDMYYSRPAEELIFVTISEHMKLHARGRAINEETKQRISIANKGLKRTEETKQRISIANKGKHMSEDAKRKMSEIMKGRIPWNKGFKCGPLSEEHKRRLSEAHKGKVVSEEIRRKLSETQKGKTHKGQTWKLIDGHRVWMEKEDVNTTK